MEAVRALRTVYFLSTEEEEAAASAAELGLSGLEVTSRGRYALPTIVNGRHGLGAAGLCKQRGSVELQARCFIFYCRTQIGSVRATEKRSSAT